MARTILYDDKTGKSSSSSSLPRSSSSSLPPTPSTSSSNNNILSFYPTNFTLPVNGFGFDYSYQKPTEPLPEKSSSTATGAEETKPAPAPAKPKAKKKKPAEPPKEDVKKVLEGADPALVNAAATQQQDEAHATATIDEAIDKQTPTAPVDNSKPKQPTPDPTGYMKKRWERSPEGAKWRNYIEGNGTAFGGRLHVPGLMVPGSRATEMITQLAALEKDPQQMDLEYAKLNQKDAALEKRAQNGDRYLTKLRSDWNEHIKNRGKGYWAETYIDPGTGKNGEQLWWEYGDKMMEAIQEAGIDVRTLTPRPVRAGGFAEMKNPYVMKSQMNIDNLVSFNDQIGKWIEMGAFDPNTPAGKDPDVQTEIQATFDKMGEWVIGQLGGSTGVMADAEKIRMQYELAAPQDKAIFDQFLYGDNGLFKSLQSVMTEGNKKEMEMSSDETVRNFKKAWDNGDWPKIVYYMMNATKSNLPVGMPSVVAAYEMQYKTLVEQFMRNGNVDRAAVWKIARQIMDRENTKSTGLYKRLGLGNFATQSLGDYDDILAKSNLGNLSMQKFYKMYTPQPAPATPPQVQTESHTGGGPNDQSGNPQVITYGGEL